MLDNGYKKKIEDVLGVKEGSEVVRILESVKENLKEDSGKDIDRVVKVLNKRIPGVEYRYKQLTSNIDEPMEKIKILAYLVKSIAHSV